MNSAPGLGKRHAHMGGWPVICALVAVLAFALAVLAPASASAAAPDPSRSCTLTAKCVASDKPVAGVRLSLFRVAGFAADGSYELADEYAASGVELNDLHLASEWGKAAEQLERFTSEAGYAALASETSDATGEARFSGLEPGIYLAPSSVGKTAAGESYISAAFLVSVPGREVTDGPWVYDVTVEPKFERTSDDDDDDKGGDSDDKGGDSDGGGSSDGQSGEDGSSNSSERAPQTSDLYTLAAPAALAACGLSLVLLARRLS